MPQGRYFVNSIWGIEEEAADEENHTTMAALRDTIGRVTQEDVEILEGEGAMQVSLSEIEKMEGPEKELRIGSMVDELTSMNAMGVFDEMAPFQLTEKHWPKGIRAKTAPANMGTVRHPT